MISLPVSLFSLVIASSKLYYSQQLGDFSVSDPSLTMIAKVSPLNIILLLGNFAWGQASSANYTFATNATCRED